jgi:CrcB protein
MVAESDAALAMSRQCGVFMQGASPAFPSLVPSSGSGFSPDRWWAFHPSRVGRMVKTYLAVMLGGAVGTGLRMWLASWLTFKYGDAFPLGTLAVNISGCFVIGLFAALTGPEGGILASPLTRQVVMIGVLGGYTTFSSFSLQTLHLYSQGEWVRGSLNILLSVGCCLIAVWPSRERDYLVCCRGRPGGALSLVTVMHFGVTRAGEGQRPTDKPAQGSALGWIQEDNPALRGRYLPGRPFSNGVHEQGIK